MNMNSKIKALNEQLAGMEIVTHEIKGKLQEEWDEVFKDLPQLQQTIEALEKSNEYCFNEFGEIASYISLYSDSFSDCKEYFKEYMREEHHIEVDFVNGILTYSMGPSIVINEDGDVLDQDGDKWIISKAEYRNEETGELDLDKRNELIEAYMEKTGCFPGVFESDRYGNINAVSTVKGTK